MAMASTNKFREIYREIFLTIYLLFIMFDVLTPMKVLQNRVRKHMRRILTQPCFFPGPYSINFGVYAYSGFSAYW